MSAQIEKWGHHYWVVYYNERGERIDEAGPFEESGDAEDVLERYAV